MRKTMLMAAAAAATVIVVGALAVSLFGGGPSMVSAQTPVGPAQSDHALFGGSEHVHCGVAGRAESYTLHVAATTGVSSGTLTITFADLDALPFSIPANSSFSTTQELGGVPTVDDVVRINPGGGVTGGVASVKARAGVQDPFFGDFELDNFCLTHNATHIPTPISPSDPGNHPF